MISRSPPAVFVEDLRKSGTGNSNWFNENSPRGVAGRCLLDAIEYLHTAPKYPARYWHVVNAHAIRLVHRCLVDPALNRGDVLNRMTPHIEETCQQFLNSRQSDIPYFGDDYWDWASVVNAIVEVRNVSRSAAEVASDELALFSQAVQDRMPGNLSVNDPDREWYGPAMASLAHRVLSKQSENPSSSLRQTLKDLKSQALEKIEDGKYRGRKVSIGHMLWHYGQVVALFNEEATDQARQLADFSWLDEPKEKAERVFVLARVLQGAYAVEDKPTVTRALDQLYKCENKARPLGQGLMGDTVKGSLNVLDALWPSLADKDKTSIGAMLDALLFEYAKANTIGFIVAIPHEMDNIIDALGNRVKVEARTKTTVVVRHPKFRAVICQGKSPGEVVTATTTAIKDYGAKCVIMAGIAGSLGKSVEHAGTGVQFIGPKKGDVIVATSMAPFRIRDKVREHIVNASVPYNGDTWMIIPTDPQLFALAHAAAQSMSVDLRTFFEGMIVTGRGIMDSKPGKAEIHEEFPGGLAVEEEGYMMGLVCLGHGVPYLNIRAISDLAEGDKARQNDDANVADYEQRIAARSASMLAVKVAELLSEQW